MLQAKYLFLALAKEFHIKMLVIFLLNPFVMQVPTNSFSEI